MIEHVYLSYYSEDTETTAPGDCQSLAHLDEN